MRSHSYFLVHFLFLTFQRCAATVFASTGATAGRDPHSFVTAPQASADPAASMVSLNPSSESALHFGSFLISISLLTWTKMFIGFIWWRWSFWIWITHLQSALSSSTSCHSCVCLVKSGFGLWKDFADLLKPIPGCHSIKNTFLALFWVSPLNSAWAIIFSMSGWESSHISTWLLYKQLHYFISSPIVKFKLLKYTSEGFCCFLDNTTRQEVPLRVDSSVSVPEIEPLASHMKTPWLASWVGFRQRLFHSCDIQELSPHDACGHAVTSPLVVLSCLRSNRWKGSTDSPSVWSELAMVAKLGRVTSDYFTLEWES